MMKCYRFVCPAGTTFKAGSVNGEDIDTVIHSDTLFSAIINAYVLLYGSAKVELFINEFVHRRIAISSVNYGLTSAGQDVLFFPKPLLDTKDSGNLTTAKQAKKVRFVSLGVLEKMLLHANLEQCQSNYSLLEGNVLLGGGFAATEQEVPPLLAAQRFMHETTDTKVQMDRRTGGAAEGMLYYESYVELTALTDRKKQTYQPFMYFLADVSGGFEAQFNACIRLLCDEGIGGERAQGRGQFGGLTIQEFSPPVGQKHGGEYALSLVYPASAEEFERAQRYQLITRGGHPQRDNGEPGVPQSQQRKWVRMLQEGAIFNQPVQGTLIDIKPDKASQIIYRNGINFSLQF